MKHLKKCRSCWWGMLRDRQKLEQWLLEVLGAEFRYQWSLQDGLGGQEPRPFRYVHPDAERKWLEEGPCQGCPCQSRCNEVCALRARWWDARMALLRQRLGCGK